MSAAKWVLFIAGALSFMASGEHMASGNPYAGVIFAMLGGLSFGVVMGIRYDEGMRTALAATNRETKG